MSDDSLQTNLGPDADTAIEHADSEVLPIVSPATACYPAGYFCFTDWLLFWWPETKVCDCTTRQLMRYRIVV